MNAFNSVALLVEVPFDLIQLFGVIGFTPPSYPAKAHSRAAVILEAIGIVEDSVG